MLITSCYYFLVASIYRLLGYKPSDLIGRSAYDYCHAQDMEVIVRAYRICKSVTHFLSHCVILYHDPADSTVSMGASFWVCLTIFGQEIVEMHAFVFYYLYVICNVSHQCL